MTPEPFSYQFHLGMSSADPAGVLYFPELFRHAHDAYEAFMASLDHNLVGFFEANQPAIPIVHAESDFLKPMRHGDDIRVAVRVERLGESSMTLGFEFIGPGGELCATSRTTHVFIERTSGRPVAIPDSLRRRLRNIVIAGS
jgi:1,4-dihydroxy-2-naphthoyl-CoA hydrolase